MFRYRPPRTGIEKTKVQNNSSLKKKTKNPRTNGNILKKKMYQLCLDSEM